MVFICINPVEIYIIGDLMAITARYCATTLAGTGKKGVIAPDANGYRTLVIGAMNSFNSAGEYYKLQGAKELFESSSEFMRRVKDGNLKGEVGHPNREPGMDFRDFVKRVFTIEETNVCAHIAEVWLDFEYGKNNPQFKNPDLVAIMARVKGSGPFGAALEASLANPEENVCFSIRAITKDTMVKGINYRVLERIITFDWVTEPGIDIAKKYHSPALESFELDSAILTQAILAKVIEESKNIVAMESSCAIMREAMGVFNTPVVAARKENNLCKHW